MTTIYRGVEVAPLNNAAGSEIPANTVYRGVQHKIVESKSTQSGNVIYRGVERVA